jgi:beta-lactamase regulating signal transducer with metallopeptidase domain
MSAFLEALFHLCILVTIAILVVMGSRTALRRYASARLAYTSWLVIPIAATTFVIAKCMPTGPIGLPVPSALQAPTILVSSAPFASQTGLDTASVLFAVWLIGMCAMAVWFVQLQHRFGSSLGSLTLENQTTTTTPVLRSSNTATGPLVFGLVRSRIVVPADFYERYSVAEQQLVIAHEVAHVRHGDLYVNALATLTQIVFWFNPLVHLAVSRLRFDQELACDARILNAPHVSVDQAKTYASAVLKAALPRNAPPLACHWHSRHPLNERILAMTTSIPRRATRGAAKVTLTTLIAASCYGAIAFADRSSQPHEGGYKVDLEYVGVDTTTRTSDLPYSKKYSLVLGADNSGTLKLGANDACSFVFSVKPTERDEVSVPFSLNCGDAGNSNSRLSTKLGARSTIRREIEHSNGERRAHTLSFVINRTGTKAS